MSTTWLNDRETSTSGTYGRKQQNVRKPGRWSATTRMAVLMAISLVSMVGCIGFDWRIVPLLIPVAR